MRPATNSDIVMFGEQRDDSVIHGTVALRNSFKQVELNFCLLVWSTIVQCTRGNKLPGTMHQRLPRTVAAQHNTLGLLSTVLEHSEYNTALGPILYCRTIEVIQHIYTECNWRPILITGLP